MGRRAADRIDLASVLPGMGLDRHEVGINGSVRWMDGFSDAKVVEKA